MATSRGKYTNPLAREAVIELTARGYSPTQALDYLEKQAAEASPSDGSIPRVPRSEIPHLRTIQRIVKEDARVDVSGPWSVLTADAAEAALVLPALADVLGHSRDGTSPVTVTEGQMMAKILTGRPELVGKAYRLARAYLKCQATGTPPTVLDAAMAFAPWQGGDAATRFHEWHLRMAWDDAMNEQSTAVVFALTAARFLGRTHSPAEGAEFWDDRLHQADQQGENDDE